MNSIRLSNIPANKSHINISKIVGSVFVFSTTIPWFGISSLDSQPWPLMFAIFYLFLKALSRKLHLKIPKYLFVFAGLVFVGIFNGYVFNVATGQFSVDFLLIRGVINYISIPIFILAYYIFIKDNGFPLRIFIVANIIWLLGAVLQLFIPGIFSFFVASRTTFGRGVTSLAPEPTFFAIYLYFSSWVCLICTNYNLTTSLKIILLLNFFAIIFLAKSMTVIIFLVITVAALFFKELAALDLKKVIKIISFFIISISFFLIVINYLIPESRIAKLAFLLSDKSLIQFIKLDASVNDRFSHVVIPIQGVIKNYGSAGGFHSYDLISKDLINNYGSFFETSEGTYSAKILSWLGSFIYELGIWGILSLCLLYVKSLNGTSKRFYEISILFLILFSAIPLIFPFVPFLFASFAIKK